MYLCVCVSLLQQFSPLFCAFEHRRITSQLTAHRPNQDIVFRFIFDSKATQQKTSDLAFVLFFPLLRVFLSAVTLLSAEPWL